MSREYQSPLLCLPFRVLLWNCTFWRWRQKTFIYHTATYSAMNHLYSILNTISERWSSKARTRICSKITALSNPNGTLLIFIPSSLCCLEWQGLFVANVNIVVLSSGKYIQKVLWEERSSSIPALKWQMSWRHWALCCLKYFENVCLSKITQYITTREMKMK